MNEFHILYLDSDGNERVTNYTGIQSKEQIGAWLAKQYRYKIVGYGDGHVKD